MTTLKSNKGREEIAIEIANLLNNMIIPSEEVVDLLKKKNSAVRDPALIASVREKLKFKEDFPERLKKIRDMFGIKRKKIDQIKEVTLLEMVLIELAEIFIYH